MDLYEVLEVAPTAAPEEIRAAITQQRRVWIRRQASPDPARRTEAEERVRQIDQAERTLLDANRRAVFDRRRASGATRRPPPTRSHERTAPVGGSEEWLERARTYLDQGNAGAARRAAERACAVDPASGEAWVLRGRASVTEGYVDNAEDEFAEALRLGEDGPDVRAGLGTVHLRKGRWERAVADLQAVLRERPDDPVARAGIGTAYVHTRRRRAGLKILREVMKQPPADSADRRAVADAVYDSAVACLAQLQDGSFLPVTRRQVAAAARHARWLTQLQPEDPTAQTRAEQLRQLARDARKAHWLPSQHKRWYALALLVALVPLLVGGDPFSGNFAWVLCGVVVLVYVWRHRKPTWKLRRRELRTEIRNEGL